MMPKMTPSEPSRVGSSRPPLSSVGVHPPSAMRSGRPRTPARRSCSSSGATKPMPASMATRPCFVSASSMCVKLWGPEPARPSGSKPASPGTFRTKRLYAGSGRNGSARSWVSDWSPGAARPTPAPCTGSASSSGVMPSLVPAGAASSTVATPPARVAMLPARAARATRWRVAAAAERRRCAAKARAAQPAAGRAMDRRPADSWPAAGPTGNSATAGGTLAGTARSDDAAARGLAFAATKDVAAMEQWVGQDSTG
mmetsp:Transcript_79030/g.223421  ORF Transcript_79030/g.223421 Transcript_79030/m.223421 type:complete len:255 (+) Transcript_79030:311-1075(+)